MGRRTFYGGLPDQPYDPRITTLKNPFRPPTSDAAGVPLDNFKNRTITNTTPIQLVGNAASVRVLPRNDRRTGLLIQNRDPANVLFIGFGNAADANSPALPAGGAFLFDFTCPAGELYLFATTNVLAVLVDMSRGA